MESVWRGQEERVRCMALEEIWWIEGVGRACYDRVQEIEPKDDQERQEAIVIANTHALINPRAVMVLAVHAFVANEAVEGVLWLQDTACWANVSWLEVLIQFQE